MAHLVSTVRPFEPASELVPGSKLGACARSPGETMAGVRRSISSAPGGTAMRHKARVELVLDCAEPRRLAEFWREALDYRDFYADENLAVLVPKDGIASPLLLQGVPEP